MPKKTKYQPLADYLSTCGQDDVTLTFNQIEDILGFKLSPSARQYRPNWANNPVEALSWGWKLAGYESYSVDVENEIAHFRKEDKFDERYLWEGSDYDPKITNNQWIELMNNSEIFDDNSFIVLKRFKDIGEASCSQVAEKYGNNMDFYRNVAVSLAQRVDKKLGLNKKEDFWEILFLGKNKSNKFVWKLRSELNMALDEINLDKYNLYDKKTANSKVNYWWLTFNPQIFNIEEMNNGDMVSCSLYNENNNKKRIFAHFLAAKKGDKVIGYSTKPDQMIQALFEVYKPQDGKEIIFKKIKNVNTQISYDTCKKTPKLQNMEYLKVFTSGTLYKLTEEEYKTIISLCGEEDYEVQEDVEVDFTKSLFIDDETIHDIQKALEIKNNVILQGPPGVGKTYAAKKIAYSIIGENNDDQIEFIQFHQNYSYEDFVMGYKPDGATFTLKKGVFYRFVEKAKENPDKKYFFIIDEINRGNLSKIFGELLMLIEKDYRETEEVTLAYSDEKFTIPKNIYILGMMNTADRSIAMIDYALRRRFSFITISPAFENDKFKAHIKDVNDKYFEKLISRIIEINKAISEDESLGKGFCIGHSYFSKNSYTHEELTDIVKYEIIPMIEEYWFDNENKVEEFKNKLLNIDND